MASFYKIVAFATMIFFSTTAFSQGRGVGRTGISPATRANQASLKRQMAANNIRVTGIEKREQARVNGILNANENATEQAKSRANENSVLELGSQRDPANNNKDKDKKTPKDKKEKKNG
jgi:hypothetical protein